MVKTSSPSFICNIIALLNLLLFVFFLSVAMLVMLNTKFTKNNLSLSLSLINIKRVSNQFAYILFYEIVSIHHTIDDPQTEAICNLYTNL